MKHSIHVLLVIAMVVFLGIGSIRVINAQDGSTSTPDDVQINAELTPVIGYQGRLMEDGAPVTGVKSMTFKLYNAATSGTLIWSETKNVGVSNGMFNTMLGDTTPFSEAIRGNMTQNLWLEVVVAGTVLPRQRLMGAPFAFTLAPGAVIEAQGPQYALNVQNDTTDGSGLYVRGKYGIYTTATSGYGISAYSESGHAVDAQSNGAAHGGAALQAVTMNNAGIAIWAEASSSDSTLVSVNAGSGPLIKAFGAVDCDEEFIVLNDGTVKQDLAATGLVKAGVKLLCNNTGAGVIRSFNNAGAYTIVSNGPSVGTCYIEFGFDLTNHYWSVTNTDAFPDIVQCEIDQINSYRLLCHKWERDGDPIVGYMMVFIY